MILEKVKKSVSNFSNFYASQFLPASKQYFEKEINKAYSKITFNKDNLLFNNKSKIRFNSLTIRIPLIDEFLTIRRNIKSYDEFISLSYIAFDEYYKRLKDINTHYYVDSYDRKNTTFANNVIFDKRNLFYLNIHFIFLCIEKQQSIDFSEEKVKQEQPNEKLTKLFNQLTVDIENRVFFDSEKKHFILNKYKITPLQSFQILIIYFLKEYRVNQNFKRQHIYDLFNNHFNMEGKKMTSKNWYDYTKLIDLGHDIDSRHSGKIDFYRDLLKLR